MLNSIKRYILSNDISVDILKDNYFKKIDNGEINYYYRNFNICDDIELNIKIILNSDGTLSFDDYENVWVMDEEFGQPYTPFYGDKSFFYLNMVIKRYNYIMDGLVNKGILEKRDLDKENAPATKKLIKN